MAPRAIEVLAEPFEPAALLGVFEPEQQLTGAHLLPFAGIHLGHDTGRREAHVTALVHGHELAAPYDDAVDAHEGGEHADG